MNTSLPDMTRSILNQVSTATLLAGTLMLTSCGPDLTEPDFGYEDIRVESFDLIDTAGQPADETILDGRYTVVDFIFTNCPIYCPTMAVAMRRVQEQTWDTDARLLSISVDGVNDTPEVLDEYADAIGADRDRWTFLTGDREAVASLCEDQFKLGVSIDASRPIQTKAGETMDFIDHPTRLILVGPDRQVLGTYSYNDPAQIDALIDRLRAIARD
jgi:protein SCO1/2